MSSPALVIDSSALSVLVAWSYVRHSATMPRKRRRDILADTYGGKLLPDSAFEALWASFVRQPQQRIVTSNVLQEVWKASLPGKLRLSQHDFVSLAAAFQEESLMHEKIVRFQDLWADEAMRDMTLSLGVTDAGLCWVARSEKACLLTEDAPLANEARANDLEVVGASLHRSMA